MGGASLLVEAFRFKVLGSSSFGSSLLAQAVVIETSNYVGPGFLVQAFVLWFAQAAWPKPLYLYWFNLVGSSVLVQTCWL